MGMTMAEKLLARASGKVAVQPGDIIWANVDVAMMDDVLGPRIEIADKMQELEAEIWDHKKVVVILDHYSPAANVQQAEILKFTREWAQENNVRISIVPATSKQFRSEDRVLLGCWLLIISYKC